MDNERRDTLDFIYEHTKGSIDVQFAAADALDAKAFQILTAASIVIGLSGLTISSTAKLGGYVLLPAIFLYIVVAAFAFFAVAIARFRSSYHADVLWPQYWDQDVVTIKRALVDDIADSYAHNNEILYRKSGLIRWMIGVSAFQIVLVGIAIVTSWLA